MTCPHCKGQGRREGPLGYLTGLFYCNPTESCPLCHGSGTVTPETAAEYEHELATNPKMDPRPKVRPAG